jgi:hypothetical protein
MLVYDGFREVDLKTIDRAARSAQRYDDDDDDIPPGFE